MSFSQPSPPDPYALAGAQTQLNTAAAQTAAGLSEGNVINPYSTTMVQGAGGPNPTYTQTLSPTQARLFNQASRIGAGTQSSGLYGQTLPDFTSMSSPLMKEQLAALNPIFAQQESNLAGSLYNKGIGAGPGGPGGIRGTDAYSNAWRNQNVGEDQALMAFEPQAFAQEVQQYNQPLQTMQSLFALATPGGVQPPPTMYQTQNPQPANLMGAAEQNYAQQNQIFGNTMAGIGNLASAGITGLFGLKNPGGGSWLVG